MKMNGFTAIVTGGGTGIGRSICVAYAREGADVAVVYNSSKKGAEETAAMVEAEGRTAIVVQCDMGDVDAIFQMVNTVYEKFGRIDVLVNNGSARNPGRLSNYSAADWDIVMNTNVRGMFFSMQAVAPIMKQQNFGKIINVSSLMGLRPSNPMKIAYTSSKRAIISLTASAAKELGPDGIYVNCIVPGSITTANLVKTSGVSSAEAEALIELRKTAIPLGRRGGVADIDGGAVYLACHDSDYVSGTNLIIDGGWLSGD